jgi:L-threonylcarbamoyladenylate synthase
MKTKVLQINEQKFSARELIEPVKLLQKGEVVAFPTETVYGLGANAFNESAIKKIFAAKNRPADNPTIIHICNEKQLHLVVQEVPTPAKKLIKRFWPGPLTLVLKKSPRIPFEATAGLDTVAVRMPQNKVALALIKKCGFPIAAPSANSSGKPSPTTAQHVHNDLAGRIHLIIDSGPCEIGLESTVLSMVEKKPVLLRPGKITVEQIEKVIGKIIVPDALLEKKYSKKPASPGMKYKHYSPNATVILVLPKKGVDFSSKVFELGKDKKVGIISFTKKVGLANEYYFDENLDAYAKSVFAAFRDFDEQGAELIVVEGVTKKGLGLAIMNRVKKAASVII